MVEYSTGLAKKLSELNGGYDPSFMSIGRLVSMIGNPYGCYPGLSNPNRSEIAKVIRNKLSPESFKVAYNFTNLLLFKKYDLELPNILENSFKRVNNYSEYLEDLIQMRKSTASTCAKDNMDFFRKSRNGGIFQGKVDSPLIMKSWEPLHGDVVRTSFRTKTRDSFVEKALERFIRMDVEVIDKIYYISEIGREIRGIDIFKEYFGRLKSSGMDLYEFHAQQNPQYLRGKELERFKERFIAIFPVDHDGAKIVVKTTKDAKHLAEDILDKSFSKYGGFPIHLRLCEDNVKLSCKDESYTLCVGGMLSHSGITEMKIQSSSSLIESEFGKNMHILYKDEKQRKLSKSLSENKHYQNYYLNLCRAFEIKPTLLIGELFD